MEVVGGHMSQVRHSRREQDWVVVEDSHQQQCNDRVFPGVEKSVHLAGLAAYVPLVEIEQVVNVGQHSYSKCDTPGSRRTRDSPDTRSDSG